MPDPRKDWDAIHMMARLLKKPRTVPELMAAQGVSERTIYRWLADLRTEGHDVVSRRHPATRRTYFSIAR